MKGAIDVWCNPFEPEFAKQTLEDPEIGAVVKWWHAEERYGGRSTEAMLKEMDEVGVEKILMPSFQQYSFMRKTMIVDFKAEDVYKLTKKAPDRFYGLYGVNPYKRMDGVRELEKAVKEWGFKGAHIHTYGFGLPIDGPDYYPYYAKCEELGVPVEMQVGHSAEMMPSEMGRPIRLDNIALYFPGLNIVGAHTGWPWCEELIALAWKHPNVYISTSGHMPRYWDKSLVQFMSTRGLGKVMFATDFPVVTPTEGITQINELGLKEVAKQQLLRETAVKVYNL